VNASGSRSSVPHCDSTAALVPAASANQYELVPPKDSQKLFGHALEPGRSASDKEEPLISRSKTGSCSSGETTRQRARLLLSEPSLKARRSWKNFSVLMLRRVVGD